jgi:O-antigen/teichoic acid export membrane protein
MGVASLVACLLLLPLLRPTLRTDGSFTRVIVGDHWRYGRWIAVAAVPTWVMENIYYVVLPMSVSFAQAGALKALLILAMPATNTIIALGILLVPVFVRVRNASGPSAMKRTMKRSVAVFLIGCGCYLGALIGFRSQIFHVLYADKYAAYKSWPLLLVGLIPMAQSITNVMGAALRALERPKLLFWSFLAGGITAIVFGIPLALVQGLCGALIGVASSIALTAALAYLFFIRATQCQSIDQVAGTRCGAC